MHILEAGNRVCANEPEYMGLRAEWMEDKFQVLSQYRFPICHEHIAGIKGCLAPRIFDCLQAGCVPIYLGAPNITDYVPSNTFIDKRKFTYPELLEYLESVDREEFEGYLHNIQAFLNSDEGKAHFERDWAEAFCDALLRDYL